MGNVHLAYSSFKCGSQKRLEPLAAEVDPTAHVTEDPGLGVLVLERLDLASEIVLLFPRGDTGVDGVPASVTIRDD